MVPGAKRRSRAVPSGPGRPGSLKYTDRHPKTNWIKSNRHPAAGGRTAGSWQDEHLVSCTIMFTHTVTIHGKREACATLTCSAMART